MILLLTGATHTGKTLMAQRLLERYGWPYLSIDLLKMGLIRSKHIALTPEDDRELEAFLWPIVREMVRTAIENRQNLIVEGGYIPFSWEEDFSPQEREEIEYRCLVMTSGYIENHFDEIKRNARAIEDRLDDSWCTKELLLSENARYEAFCRRTNAPMLLIDESYPLQAELWT